MKHVAQVLSCCALAVLTANGASATAQPPYPQAPITVVVSYAAGGTADLATRIVAEAMSQELKVPFVVENRPGGGGAVGVQAALRAKPDGYTLMSGSSEISLAATGKTPAPDDVLERLNPLAQVAVAPMVMVARADRPESVQQWRQRSRDPNDRVTYATPGVMTPMHLIMTKLGAQAGMLAQHIPYNGGGRAVADLMGGQIDLVVVALGSAMGQIQAGQVKALAVLNPARSSLLPQVPTIGEALDQSFGAIPLTWFGWLAPVDTPAPAQARLAAALKAVMEQESVRERLLQAGLEPRFLDAAAFRSELAAEADYYREAAELAAQTQ
ncbi:MAG TPA: tripartite tricarboxylate transporter substrate binding protein [Alcaligenes sp.]|nr:tripartite tricarboxylate transporter substrate binding protein [Alcaligenes sp.]HRL28422.1 tripartite tricarboxylate transporter substrate binding protein [Alcaligenes sp.]